MIIDFFKAKEKIESKKPQGYWGFLKRKREHERLEELTENINEIISSGSKELLKLNRSSRKNMKYMWLIILYIEAIFFFSFLQIKNDSVSTTIIVLAMIFFLVAGVGLHVFLRYEYKDILRHSQPLVLPKTDKPPYYSKNNF